MKKIAVLVFLLLVSCQKKGGESDSKIDIKGALSQTMSERQLNDSHLVGAFSTYTPSGATDDYLGFLGTGDSGRLVVLGMPSMRILKYVAVFSSEPWQGYSFDDESKALIASSSRDEIEYDYGDTGRPAISLTNGRQDGRAVFMSDAANGRIAVVDLLAYETKQIISHPLFHSAGPDLDVANNSDYILQTSMLPENVEDMGERSGVTFWKFVEKEVATEGESEKHFFIDYKSSFTIFTPASRAMKAVMLKGNLSQYAFFYGNQNSGQTSSLYLLDWKKQESLLATKAKQISGMNTFKIEDSISDKIAQEWKLDFKIQNITTSGDGKFLAIIPNDGNFIQILSFADRKDLNSVDLFSNSTKIELSAKAIDVAFARNVLLISTNSPNKMLKYSLSDKKILSELDLPFVSGQIVLPGAEGVEVHDELAAVANHTPHSTFKKVSPQMGLGLHLFNFKDKLVSLYDASIPQATRMSGVVMSKKANLAVFKYKIGTDPRSGEISYYRTFAGKERIERDGKRVHVYATVIRSHITPDTIEVEQDDIVTIHITSQEQSKDQTHGFTIDTYNVHGSWEPGKTAAVTFVADRAGVFPFYCTEFCSALHLEMQGYLLVKPRNMSSAKDTLGLNQMRNNKKMTSFFKYIKGE